MPDTDRIEELEGALGALANALLALGPPVRMAVQGNARLLELVRAERKRIEEAEQAQVEAQRTAREAKRTAEK
jgi:hypothetical protein